MSFNIAKWYNNFQVPVVLMIDDLSDAYIDVFNESYRNDWGYMTTEKGSAYDFLKTNLLNQFPEIKITFFVPYLKHNVINDNTIYDQKKYSLGEREQYIDFLKILVENNHEIAHHGSNHGEFIDNSNCSTVNNWTHEWALFKDINTGVKITQNGIDLFKSICNIDIVGGKYCGYIDIDNSQEIIDKCNFIYWCESANFNPSEYKTKYFGYNKVFSFPTTFAGNSFVRLSYITGHKKKDLQKKFFKYFQPLYNILSYKKLHTLYKQQSIISIQEHISPSTAAGTIQSANIISDIASLNKIFKYLKNKSVWYETCQTIAKYVYVRDNSSMSLLNNELIINFNNFRSMNDTLISISHNKPFTLKTYQNIYTSNYNNGLYVVNISIINGKNIFLIDKEELQ